MSDEVGWKCPSCSRCYAPSVKECRVCGNSTSAAGGGYSCPACGTWVNYGTQHRCLNPTSGVPLVQTGWTCTNCGRFVYYNGSHTCIWTITNQTINAASGVQSANASDGRDDLTYTYATTGAS